MSLDSKAIDFYNRYWNEYKPFSNYKLRRIIQILKLLMFIKPQFDKLKILDSGCGDGRSVSIWNNLGNAVGIDQSDQAIKNASKHFPFINFYNGDVICTDLDDESFNVIISQEVIEHVEQQEQYLCELARLLCKNGYLILTTPNKFFFDRRNGGNWSNQPVENLIRIKDLKRLLKPHFTIVKLQTVILAKGHKGIYRLFTNKLILFTLNKVRLYRFYETLMEKANLGVHVVLLARKN